MRRIGRPLLAAVAAAALATNGPALAGDWEVKAWLDPVTVGVEDTTTLTIQVSGGGFSSVAFDSDFDLDNLVVVGGPSRGQKLSFVNGAVSRTESAQWLLKPEEAGKAAIRRLTVRVGDSVEKLPDLALEVAAGSLSPQSRQPSRQDPFDALFGDVFPPRRQRSPEAEPKLFLRAEVTPRQPFVGQQLLYVLYLFSQADIGGIHAEELPDFQGFWVREIPEPGKYEPEIVEVDGERYARVPLLRRVLFPLRAGELEIPPCKIRLSVRLASPGAFRSLIPRSEEVWRESNAVPVVAAELPPPPEGFQGAVGQLRLAAELDPESVAVGEATTLTVTLSGEGHLQGLPAPRLPPTQGVRRFAPHQSSDERVVGNRVQGRRSWSWVLIPEQAGRFALPPFELAYFDPQAAEYKIARAPALEIEVAGGGAAEPAAAARVVEPAPATGRERAPAGDEPVRAGHWAVFAAAALAAVVLIATFAFRHRRRRPHRPGRPRLSAIRAAERIPDVRRAAAALETSWRDYLDAAFSIGPGTPSTRWASLLEGRGIPPTAAAELQSLADDLHYLRYAPQLSTADHLHEELVNRSKRLRRSLE